MLRGENDGDGVRGLFNKGGEALSGFPPPGFDFNGVERVAMGVDEVHLGLALAPVVQSPGGNPPEK